MRSLSFLSKMTIFGFLLGTLPVLFIGAYAYITSSNAIQENVVSGNSQLLMQINSNVEQKLTTVNHTLNQVIHSTVLKEAINHPLSADDFMTYNDIRNEIRYMQSFDTKLEDVILINERHNWMVKNSGLYDYGNYPYHEQLTSLRDIPEGVSWVLTPSEWFYSEENARSTTVCSYSISLVKKLPTAGLEKYGLAVANIPACGLQELVELETSNESLAQMIILDEQNRILLHRDPALIGQPADAAGMPAELLTDESGQFVVAGVAGGEGKQSVTYYRSELNGWQYLSVSSISAMTKESAKIGMYTLYVCLFMLLLSMLLAWIGSKRMYSPIQLLLTQVGERMTDAGKRSRNEFQVISERVHHLFQSKSRLEQEVQQHVQQARSFFLMRALQGNVRASTVPEKLAQFGYGEQLDEWRAMAVMALQIDFQEDSRYSKSDLELLLFAVQNIVEELVPARDRLAPVSMDNTIFVVVGSSAEDPEAFSEMMYAVTEQVQSQVAGYLQLQISIGLSLPFGDVNHLAVACRESIEALKQRMKLGTGIIIQHEHLHQEGTQTTLGLSYPSFIENELLDAIKLAEKESAKELLKQFLHAVFAEELSPREYQIPLARLLNSLLVVMQESGVGLAQIHPMKGSLLEELLKLPTHAEIEDWFWTSVVHPMLKIFRDRREAQYHNISEKIIDLVQHHYDSDLTLEECAARLHYNANYLSSVFRKETGHSFSEYLTMYRFNMAKRWLSDSEMPIKDIAAKLRYNNPQNFIRSFRKQEGITPGQFRERKRSG